MPGRPRRTTQFQTIFGDKTMDASTALTAANNLFKLRHLMPIGQQLAIREALNGEESRFFTDKLAEFAGRIDSMPKTYEQDGKGRQAVAYLHYFVGSADWYITERDADEDGEGQIQAFGEADLGYGPELGYISIAELVEVGAELDLYFEPTTLSQLDVKRA